MEINYFWLPGRAQWLMFVYRKKLSPNKSYKLASSDKRLTRDEAREKIKKDTVFIIVLIVWYIIKGVPVNM